MFCFYSVAEKLFMIFWSNVCSIFLEFESEQKGLSAEVLKKAFRATEEEFCELVRRELPVRSQMVTVGSCCLVGAISDNELYVANLGDSRVVLGRRISNGRNESVVAERLSNDHNVADEEVRKEVEALHPEPIVVHCRGVWRINGIIQVLYFYMILLYLVLDYEPTLVSLVYQLLVS